EQVQRDPLRRGGQLGVAGGSGVVHDGHPVGEGAERVEEMRDQGAVLPVPASTVTGGELGRKRGHAGEGHPPQSPSGARYKPPDRYGGPGRHRPILSTYYGRGEGDLAPAPPNHGVWLRTVRGLTISLC